MDRPRVGNKKLQKNYRNQIVYTHKNLLYSRIILYFKD